MNRLCARHLAVRATLVAPCAAGEDLDPALLASAMRSRGTKCAEGISLGEGHVDEGHLGAELVQDPPVEHEAALAHPPAPRGVRCSRILPKRADYARWGKGQEMDRSASGTSVSTEAARCRMSSQVAARARERSRPADILGTFGFARS